ncbi:hypothetical protein [Streptomyces phaeochromogenes]
MKQRSGGRSVGHGDEHATGPFEGAATVSHENVVSERELAGPSVDIAVGRRSALLDLRDALGRNGGAVRDSDRLRVRRALDR